MYTQPDVSQSCYFLLGRHDLSQADQAKEACSMVGAQLAEFPTAEAYDVMRSSVVLDGLNRWDAAMDEESLVLQYVLLNNNSERAETQTILCVLYGIYKIFPFISAVESRVFSNVR